MNYLGKVQKMAVIHAAPVGYRLCLDEQQIPLNPYLGCTICLRYTQIRRCVRCNRQIKKSFQQGYCYPCYLRLLECNLCTIHPERCRFYEGACDPKDWAHAHCGQQQIVYFANSSGVKVGVTGESQIPTRWIDQGAIQAIPAIRVTNRYLAGIIEVALKTYVMDKTNWRLMLKNQVQQQDMRVVRQQLLTQALPKLAAISAQYPGEIQWISDDRVYEFHYPVLSYPA